MSAPGLPFLSRWFALGAHPASRLCRGGLASVCARRCDSVAAFAIGSRPALRLCRGGLPSVRVRRCGSGAAICPRFAPGVAVLARRSALGLRPALHLCRGGLASVCARRCGSGAAVCHRCAPGVAVLSRRFSFGLRPALRFWRGGCHRFTPAVCRMAPNRTACDILRFCSAGRDRRLCVLAVLVWLSDIAGSLRVCAFLYGDLDGVTGSTRNERRGYEGTGMAAQRLYAFCTTTLALQCFPRGVRWGCAPQTAPKSLRLSGLSSRCGGVVLVRIRAFVTRVHGKTRPALIYGRAGRAVLR